MRLHIEHRGNTGPSLVLAHGFGGSARNFGSQARALSDRCQLFSYDARGHARSEAPLDASAYRPECFVLDMLDVVQRAVAPRVIAGGVSMGAGVALRFAIAHPDRVSGLVLASFPRSRKDAGHREWALGFADAIEQRGLEAAGEQFVWGQRSKFDPKGAALVRTGFLEHPPHALAHTLRELLAEQPPVDALKAELAALAMPALIIAGQDDPRSLPQSHALKAAIPDAELVVIPGGGHVVNLTNPAEFNQALESLLARVDGH